MNIRMLIVDDSATDAVFTRGICERHFPNAEIHCAIDGAEGIAAIGSRTFDIVITDLFMPVVDGLALTKRIVAKHPNLPVILMTGAGSEDIAVEALRAGASSYVPKRHISTELTGTIERLLAFRSKFITSQQRIQYFSCFISYSHCDEEFCHWLYKELMQKGIQVFYASKDMRAGDLLNDQIKSAIQRYDRLLLVLSENSMSSNWVHHEVITAFMKELDTGKRVLFPISLVPFESIRKWTLFDADSGVDLAHRIRQFYIPDFSDADAQDEKMERLLRDLQHEEHQR